MSEAKAHKSRSQKRTSRSRSRSKSPRSRSRSKSPRSRSFKNQMKRKNGREEITDLYEFVLAKTNYTPEEVHERGWFSRYGDPNKDPFNIGIHYSDGEKTFIWRPEHERGAYIKEKADICYEYLLQLKEKDGEWYELIHEYMNSNKSETSERVSPNKVVGNLLRFIDKTVKYINENYSVNKNLTGKPH